MYVVVSYYTKNTIYEKYAKKLIESLKRFSSLNYSIVPIESLGDWYKNTQYKPTFLKQMLEKFYPHSIVYVDVDAEFCRYPSYFDSLDSLTYVNIAVHFLDHSKYRRKNHPPELLSGTIFLKNNEKTRIIVGEWEDRCREDPQVWDQRALAEVLRHSKFHSLPEEYCVIFDYMESVENPVIKHYQASREVRRQVKVINSSKPRVVEKGGMVRVRRIYN